MNELQHARILNALTTHDRRQSRGKHYNRYAIAHYCKALQNAQSHCNNGADLRLALLNCFSDRLLDKCLKAVSLETSTKAEQQWGGFAKLPALD